MFRKNSIVESKNQSEISSNISTSESKNDRDSFKKNYVDPRKPHPDSIAKWNAQVMAEKQKYVAVPDDDTKFFTIDPESGEVEGCPFIKFVGIYSEMDYEKEEMRRDSLRKILKELKPKMRTYIMEGKDEMWYGDPKNVEIAGSPEAAYDEGSHLISNLQLMVNAL
ncbi:MAG: hypothetical protein R2771_08525 [Saprospiraceae bacterium]